MLRRTHGGARLGRLRRALVLDARNGRLQRGRPPLAHFRAEEEQGAALEGATGRGAVAEGVQNEEALS